MSIFADYEAGAKTEFNPEPARLKPAKSSRQAIFLLCAPRSGSTLMRVLLAGHPQLYSPPELDILWYDTMEQWQRSMTYPSLGHGFSWAAQGIQWAYMDLPGQEAGQQAMIETVMKGLEGYTAEEIQAMLSQL